MSDSSGQVIGSAAQIYEDFFVPALFGEWAPRIAQRIEPGPGQRALDVACGTGVLARELATRIEPGSVAGLDCNPGMLAVAKACGPEIDWREGLAEKLPFDDASFDIVVSQFGLMFFQDRAAALREMWRVLRPGGRMAVGVWGQLDSTPGYSAMVELLDQLFGSEIADELRAPFCLGDRHHLAELFASTGIPEVDIETVVGTARFSSIDDWVSTDVRGWTLADKLSGEQFERLSKAANSELSRFTDAGGAVSFDSPAHIATAAKTA